MKSGFPQAALLALVLATGAKAQTGPPACERYAEQGVLPGMTTREVWAALGGKGDATETREGPAGTVAVVRYSQREPEVWVEYDREDVGRNRGTLLAVRTALGGEWTEDPGRLSDRFGEPTSGAERLAEGLDDGEVEWVDLACAVRVRAWYEPASWWEPGNARRWIEIRRIPSALVAESQAPEQPAADTAPAARDTAAVATPATVPDTASATAAVAEAPANPADAGAPTAPVRDPASYVAPTYPRMAYAAGLEGDVLVDVRVGATGDVLGAVVVDARPSGRGFENAAIEAIRQWRFFPALRDGEPVEAVATVVIEFRRDR